MSDPARILSVPGGTLALHASGLTVTRLDGLGEIPAWPQEDAAYRERAAGLGYGDDVFSMSREHEAGHHALAILLGLPASPTLAGVARGRFWRDWGAEEAAVLALQRYARAAGADIVAAVERAGRP